MSEQITYTRPTPEGVRDFLTAGASHLMPAVRAYPEAALASKVAVDTCGPVRESEMQELRALYLRAVQDMAVLSDRVLALEAGTSDLGTLEMRVRALEIKVRDLQPQ